MRMNILIPVFGKSGKALKENRTLEFVDVTKTTYNVIYKVEDKRGKVKEVIICGHVNKLDIRRLAKAS